MADLDDFFAKKDRKKAKGKKFTTTEELAKKLEETGKRVIEKPKIKEKPINPEGGEDTQHNEDEDEWREFEEEKKDYTGLKIGTLTINEQSDAESDDDRGTGENSSDGEQGEGGSKHSGPWKKTDLPEQPAEQQEVPATGGGGGGGAGSGGYKIPQKRNTSATTYSSPRVRKSNVAPDINSEEYFPTLNSKQPNNEPQAWGRRRKDEGTFEEVRNRGGSRYIPESQAQAPKLSLGNKYDALSQDQS